MIKLIDATRNDICVRATYYKESVLTSKILVLTNRDLTNNTKNPSIIDISVNDLKKLILQKLELESTQAISLKFFRTIFKTSVRVLREKVGKEDAGTSTPGSLLEAVILKRFH